MCGIYGIIGTVGRDDLATLSAMGERLFHRGPDDGGQRVSRLGALGMRRLAIIDVEHGGQPVSDASGTIWATLNGEIYNYRELRAELEQRGRCFVTAGDTEVVANAYAEFGSAFVERLRGMFALAIHDEQRQQVLLARDRVGKKPLYYARVDGRIIYASEMKALLSLPECSRDISQSALRHFLTFKNVPAPQSIFAAIASLEPGTTAIVRDGAMHIQSYWRPRFCGTSPLSDEEAEARILHLLRDAVHVRMDASDVPVGAYLSGGVDSSLVVALMAEHAAKPVKTFSLGYRERVGHKMDVDFARDISRRYATDHYELELSTSEVIAELPDVIKSFDEPFSGTITSYWLSRLIASHVKVALSGDGADELFGSYANHRMAATVQHLRSTLSRLPNDYGFFSANRPLADICVSESDARWRTRFMAFTDEEKTALLRDSIGDFKTSASLLARFYSEASATDLVNATLEVDCRTLLPDQILTYVDRLTMAFSLEVRAPFLDQHLIDFVGTLPGSKKVTRTETKRILKQVARKILPAEIVDRPKEGFVLPIDAWLAGPLDKLIADAFSPSWMRHDLFRRDAVDALLAEHRSGYANHTYKIWTLLMFQLWHHLYNPADGTVVPACTASSGISTR